MSEEGAIKVKKIREQSAQHIYTCILKAHSHSMSGGSIWASLEYQCCFWIAGGWVVT